MSGSEPAQVVRFHQTGGPEVLRIDQIPLPAPGEGEVRIRVAAAGLNRGDAIFFRGHHAVQPRFPSRIGQEAAGTIDAVGRSVTDLVPGDTVSIIPRMDPERGSLSTVLVLPARFVVRNPAGISMVDAAALWTPFLTAHLALFGNGQLASGEHVIITAASSGVGLAAIQLANLAGAFPIAVTRTPDKVDRLRKAGAQHVIVTQEEDISTAVRAITRGNGAELAIDAVAGSGILDLTAAIAFRGRYVLYGILADEATPLPIAALFASQIKIGVAVLDEATVDLRAPMAEIARYFETGKVGSVVDKVFPLEEVVEAYRYLEANNQFGKVVLSLE